MKKYAVLTVFFFSHIQAPASFALPENHSFEESLGTISKNRSDDQSTNIGDINIDQSIEIILLMSPFQWAIPENTTGLKKNNATHAKKSLAAEKNIVNYRADTLDFASPQLIAEEITASQIHIESAAYIQTPTTAATVDSILEASKPTDTVALLNTDDTPEEWESLANLYASDNQIKAKAQSLPMIIQLLQWLGM